MPVDLSELGEAPDRIEHDPLDSLVANPGFAPKSWQSHAPTETFGGNKPPVSDSPDLQRILALPRRPQTESGSERALALIALMTRRFQRDRSRLGPCRCKEISKQHTGAERECITTLNLPQAAALFEMGITGGLLGLIGTGCGKTLCDLLAPMAVPDCKIAVLLIPPGLVTQLIAEYELVREHFDVPSLLVWGDVLLPGKQVRAPYFAIDPDPEVPTLNVYPYSRLSLPKSTVKLDEIGPDLIIADECHKLRHAATATTSRVLKRFDRYPDTRLCAWSGSVTDSSPKDYAHILNMALRSKSPLPNDPAVVDDWARAIEPGSWPAPPGALLALCNPGEHIHDGFHRRLVESRGVITTTTAAIDAELVIEERTAPDLPEAVENALHLLRETWQRPDGEELIDPLTVARCARELACGFYYRWKFPRGEPTALILEWLDIRKLYRSELREFLAVRRDHLDSPHLCELAAQRFHHDIAIPYRPAGTSAEEWAYRHPIWKSQFWPAWRDIKSLVQPETEAVWVDDYLVDDAAAWGLDNHGIIWYESAAFGMRIAEHSGLTMHGGGPDAGKLIAENDGKRSIVCSIKSHGTGRDGLQRHYADQLIAQPMSSSSGWEQLLARLFRIGQKAPRVYARFYRHTLELRAQVDQALARALYVQSTMGNSQKLLSGFLNPKAISEAGGAAQIGTGTLDLDYLSEDLE